VVRSFTKDTVYIRDVKRSSKIAPQVRGLVAAFDCLTNIGDNVLSCVSPPQLSLVIAVWDYANRECRLCRL